MNKRKNDGDDDRDSVAAATKPNKERQQKWTLSRNLSTNRETINPELKNWHPKLKSAIKNKAYFCRKIDGTADGNADGKIEETADGNADGKIDGNADGSA